MGERLGGVEEKGESIKRERKRVIRERMCVCGRKRKRQERVCMRERKMDE